MQRKIDRGKKKVVRKKSSARKVSASGAGLSGSNRTYRYILIGSFLMLLAVFLVKFSGLTEISNSYLERSMPFLVPLEIFLFLITAACFLYFAVKQLNQNTVVRKRDEGVLLIAFLAIGVLYCLVFSPAISTNGDNAEYLTTAKSLVERGGAYRLYAPGEAAISIAALGLPIMLAPLYSLFGFNFTVMKMLMLLMALAVLPILFSLFRKEHSFALSSMLAIAGFSSPYLISHSTDIMTETPFIFWSVLALLLTTMYDQRDRIGWFLPVAMLATLVMSYLTRPVGISAFVAVLAFLFFRVPWRVIWTKPGKVWSNLEFRKLFWIAAPLLFFFILWQIRGQMRGTSQLSFFLERMNAQFGINLDSGVKVFSQMLYADDTFRWYNLSASGTWEPLNLVWIGIVVIFLIGLVSGLYKRELLALYVTAFCLILFLGAPAGEGMVMIRYLSVTIPFIIYYVYRGSLITVNQIISLAKRPDWKPAARILAMLILAQLLFTNFSSTAFFVSQQKQGFVYEPGFNNFIEAARWCSENLPADSYILSRKPRLFYVFSGLKGGHITNYREAYSPEYEMRKLQEIKESGATHLILDGFNKRTSENIYPIVNNHRDKFETVHTTGSVFPAYVLKINDY